VFPEGSLLTSEVVGTIENACAPPRVGTYTVSRGLLLRFDPARTLVEPTDNKGYGYTNCDNPDDDKRVVSEESGQLGGQNSNGSCW